MSWDTLEKLEPQIGPPTVEYLRAKYLVDQVRINESVNDSLSWRPTIAFDHIQHEIIAGEIIASPYAPRLDNIKLKVIEAHLPISVYSVCPEEACFSAEGIEQIKQLKAEGFGLITVRFDGTVTHHFHGVPLIQHISRGEFESWLTGHPKRNLQYARSAFDSYQVKPFLGTQCISELVEAFVHSAAKKAVKKNWLTEAEAKQPLSKLIETMINNSDFKSMKTLLGGLKSYVKDYRNTAHHFPATKQDAYRKYKKCKNGFHDGVDYINRLYVAFGKIGLRPTLPQ